MFAVYAERPDRDDPVSAVRIGEQPGPAIPAGWVRVKVTHASLNQHDIFTLRGITGHDTPIPFPMILGNDAAGTLEDGRAVVVYPLVGSPGWRGDETMDPAWHVLSEKIPGTFAEYVAVPERNALPLPEGMTPLHASVMGTAWLTAYRMLFTQARLAPGQSMLVQGATGGMSTALIQLGSAAGLEVWVTSRSSGGRELAMELGARGALPGGAALPAKVDAVFDNVGAATWGHSMRWVKRGGVVVTTGVTTGRHVDLDLLPVIVNQVSVRGSIMGTLAEMEQLMAFVVAAGIRPCIDEVVPMEQAVEPIRRMADGRVRGKIVFTR